MLVSGSVRLVCGPSDVPDYPCEPSSETTLWKHIRQQIEARWQEHRERGGTRRAIEGQCRSDRRSETDHFRGDPEGQIKFRHFRHRWSTSPQRDQGWWEEAWADQKDATAFLANTRACNASWRQRRLIAPIAIDVLQTEVTHHLGVDLGDMPSAVDDTPDPNGMPAPQEAARRGHRLTHTPCARSKPDCARGQGRHDRHLALVSAALPVEGIDYCFGKREERNTTVPIFGAIDNVYLTGTAIWADPKGPRDAYVV